jgi:hypothetical protein
MFDCKVYWLIFDMAKNFCIYKAVMPTLNIPNVLIPAKDSF